jgi:hypothetical protein
MSTPGLPTIWELVAEGAATLPEPFSRAALITWVSARRPDVGVSSIAKHIQFATANASSAAGNPFAGRTPLLYRVERGLYRRYSPAVSERRSEADVPAGTSSRPSPERVVLVGSSGATASEPVPVAELFESSGFARAREYADRSGVPWFVLSAKHGLLDPHDVVSPYAVQMGDQSSAYRTAWGEWVVAQLGDRVRLEGLTVEVHGGVDFAQPLRHALARRGATLEIPLPGAWRESEPDWPAGQQDGDLPSADAEAPVRTVLLRLRGLVSRHRGDEAGDGHGSSGRLDASAS